MKGQGEIVLVQVFPPFPHRSVYLLYNAAPCTLNAGCTETTDTTEIYKARSLGKHTQNWTKIKILTLSTVSSENNEDAFNVYDKDHMSELRIKNRSERDLRSCEVT